MREKKISGSKISGSRHSGESRGKVLRRIAYQEGTAGKVVVPKGYICYICQTHLAQVVEHKYPIFRGGSHEMDNIDFACKRCNSVKHASVWPETSSYPAHPDWERFVEERRSSSPAEFRPSPVDDADLSLRLAISRNSPDEKILRDRRDRRERVEKKMEARRDRVKKKIEARSNRPDWSNCSRRVDAS